MINWVNIRTTNVIYYLHCTVLPIMRSRSTLSGLHYSCAAVTEHSAHWVWPISVCACDAMLYILKWQWVNMVIFKGLALELLYTIWGLTWTIVSMFQGQWCLKMLCCTTLYMVVSNDIHFQKVSINKNKLRTDSDNLSKVKVKTPRSWSRMLKDAMPHCGIVSHNKYHFQKVAVNKSWELTWTVFKMSSSQYQG